MLYRRTNPGTITRLWNGKKPDKLKTTTANIIDWSKATSGNRGLRSSTVLPPPRDELKHIVDRSGVRLTKDEIQILRQRLDRNGDGKVSMDEFRAVGRDSLESTWARELCLGVTEASTSKWGAFNARLIQFLDYGGKALFAVVGTQVAGDVGMNLVGCVFVGCVSCLGGGSLNNLLYGTPAVFGRPGVNWVHNPRIFYVAIAASVITFFAWPLFCHERAKEKIVELIGVTNLEDDGSFGLEAFKQACTKVPQFQETIEVAMKMKENEDPAVLFAAIDVDKSGFIEVDEVQRLIGLQFNSSPHIYALDTVALSALAVVGVHNAIGRGLAPLVAASSGVTVCFGGILRDVLCGRDVVLGAQSYAFATGAGSTVYILLRELSLRGMAINQAARVLLSIGTIVTIRALDYVMDEPLLKPMHYDPEQARYEMQRRKEAELMIRFDPSVSSSSSSSSSKSEPRKMTTFASLGSQHLNPSVQSSKNL
jgi:uncharacterized membrane protein YeiH